ncbi:MAG: glycosyltransferase family 4 protein [candidate division WOR-3 bacterium]
MNKINVLHITPHLGGGVGTVILNWLQKEYENTDNEFFHEIATLEVSKNPLVKEFKEKGLYISEGFYEYWDNLKELIKSHDIVIVHWWNHPKLFDILVNMEFPPCRLIIWSHSSGLYPPYVIPIKLIEFSDLFIFVSPVSYEADEIKSLKEDLREKIDVVWSTFGSESFEGFQKKSHESFNIGYIGTCSYTKLHPEFIRMCSKINIPNSRFIVCANDHTENILSEATELGIVERFCFQEKVVKIKDYLAIFDVFGYPLQPKHFGTSEQALGEAMMAGVVPVVLNNAAERYIVEDGKTGIIANSTEEYCKAIEFLYNNPAKREEMARNAIASAREKYSIEKKMKEWRRIFSKIFKIEKRHRNWDNKKRKTGAEVFIESIGDYGKVFMEYIQAKQKGDEKKLSSSKEGIIKLFKTNLQWYSDNKGGVKQYLKVFPSDIYLNQWNALLDKNGIIRR